MLTRIKKQLPRPGLFSSGYSIKSRVLQGTLIGAVAVFSITATTGDHLIDLWLVKEYDHALLDRARILVTLTYDTENLPELHFADEFMPEYSSPQAPHYFQLWYSNGEVMERSKSLGLEDLSKKVAANGDPGFYDEALPNGLSGRYVSFTFIPQFEDRKLRVPELLDKQKPLTLTVAIPREELDEMLAIADLSVSLGILIVIVLLVLIVRFVVFRGFHPLNRIQSEVADFDIHNRASKLSTDHLPVELEGIVRNFNNLMQRVQEGLDRERQFSSDVAHELRTPIAEIRSIADVAIRWPASAGAESSTLTDIRDASIQMQTIVDNLLSLSRSDREDLELNCDEQAIDGVLCDAIQRHIGTANDRGLAWDVSLEPDCLIWASRVELELIVNNLVDNAVQYCPDNGTVHVHCATSGGASLFSISNPAPELSESDLPRLFDRMWRKDSSRTSYTNFGLGLSLVAAYAHAMNLRINTSINDRSFLTIEVKGRASAAAA